MARMATLEAANGTMKNTMASTVAALNQMAGSVTAPPGIPPEFFVRFNGSLEVCNINV